MFVALALVAVCVAAPVNGPVVGRYAPVGDYGGHWGVDYGVPVGTEVRAPASGVVTFAGSVAGMNSVTVEPVPGLKISVSYLRSVSVARGTRVTRGQIIGESGTPHGVPGVHLSVRIGGRYLNPAQMLGCSDTDISRALRLVTPPTPYPRRREHGHSRRNLRPDSSRPPARSGHGVGGL